MVLFSTRITSLGFPYSYILRDFTFTITSSFMDYLLNSVIPVARSSHSFPADNDLTENPSAPSHH